MMPDREKVIKSLEYCRNQSGCWSDSSECPWIDECREDVNSLKDACIALLKEQKSQKFFVDESGKITPLPVVVRCKDCKWRGTKACFCKAENDVQDDWFCSEGERKI